MVRDGGVARGPLDPPSGEATRDAARLVARG